MTFRQKLFQLVYPVLMKKKKNIKMNGQNTPSQFPFYNLHFTLIDGKPFSFSALAGKKVLLVNTASNCGYTNQYADLEKLYEQKKDKLIILGFPSNDFKEQEKGDNEEIASFCKKNYGVSFPLMQKSSVARSGSQNDIYKWLTNPAKNGWNEKAPEWNFSKYLVDERGQLTHYFGTAVSPMSNEILNALNE